MVDVLERDAELALADRAYDDAAQGIGTLLLVSGPAGIGKSTLLDAFAERARGLRVLRARGDELDPGLAYGVVRQLFERLLTSDTALADRVLVDAARVARSVVMPARAMPSVSPQEATYALTWLAANLAAERPLLLIVDDLPWTDDASARWLNHLAGRVEELPVVVVASWRTGSPLPVSVSALVSTARAAELSLRPLSHAGVRAMVRSAWGPEVDEGVSTTCAELTEGNPFLVQELVRSLRDHDRVCVADVQAARPAGVARSVGRRLGAMSSAAQRMAEAVAVLGEGAELRHAAALAGLDLDSAAAGIDELAGGGILRAGRPLSFVHPLIRTATYERLGDQARARAHASAARVLASESADSRQSAKHLLLAPPVADSWAAGQLLAAGSVALTGGAATEARRLLSRALLEPPPAELRETTELALGQAELLLLDESAEARFQHLVESSLDVRRRARAASLLTQTRTLIGKAPDAAVVEEIADDLGPEDRELALDLRSQALSSGLLMYGGMPDAGRRVEQVAAGLAGDTPAELRLLGALAYHLVVEGNTSGERCADLALRAFADGRLVAESGESSAAWQAAMVLLITGRYDEAAAALRAGLQRATERSSEVSFATWSVVGCYAGWLTGQLDEAEEHGRAGWRVGQHSGFWLPRIAAATYLGRVLVDRGELDEADELIEAVAHNGPQGTTVHDTADYTRMLLRSAQGRWSDVVSLAAGIARRRGGAANPGVLWRASAAIAHARLGDRATARALLAQQRAATERWRIPRAEGLLLLAEALVAEGPEALERAEQAALTLRTADAPLELARALLAQGRLQRQNRQRALARAPLAEALDLADRCGARRLVVQAEGEIAACGGVVRRRRTTGPDALTPSELRVARLAADGLSNSQIAQSLFVTRKTVESQLSAAYRKLGITSRNELASALGAKPARAAPTAADPADHHSG